MRQELTTLMEMPTEDEFNHNDSYYSSVSDFLFMDVINALIEDISYPVFIIKNSDRLVYAVNEEARKGFNGEPVSNRPFDSLLNPCNSPFGRDGQKTYGCDFSQDALYSSYI